MLGLVKLANWIQDLLDSVDESGVLIHVTEVLPVENHVLALTFNNGDTGVVDLTCYLENRAALAPLQDIEFFRKVTIKDGMLSWPGGIQIDAVTLHCLVRSSWPATYCWLRKGLRITETQIVDKNHWFTEGDRSPTTYPPAIEESEEKSQRDLTLGGGNKLLIFDLDFYRVQFPVTSPQ